MRNKMMEVLGFVIGLLAHPLVLIDVAAHRWLGRRGYATVDADALAHARRALADTFDYVERSGHLNTVSGRRPRAIARLKGGIGGAIVLSAPDAPRIPRAFEAR